MRRITILFICSVVNLIWIYAEQTPWQWVNPLPQGNLINAMSALNQDTVLAVAEFGSIIRTTNGGTTWQVIPTAAGTNEQLFAVQYTSSTIAYAVGESGRALKSTDGGATWFTQLIPTVKDLYGISFVSATTGWVAGASGTIFGTTNGGMTWIAETSGTIVTLYAIHFESPTIGWAVGTNGTIIKSTNAGTTWTAQISGTTQALYSIDFASTSVGWVAGAFGTILRTVNGGASWTPQVTNTNLSLFSVKFASFLNGWAVGSYGIILKSTNGGISWLEQNSGTYNDLFTSEFTSLTQGWAMGDLGTIIRTTDGGSAWALQSSGVKQTLNGIHFPSTSTGYSVGEEGTIIKTTDGGIKWTPQLSGLFYTLYGTYFINDFNGWAVGDSAVILHTTNGGATWIDQHSRTDPTLYSVHFISTNGWTVGDFGTILYSSNSGSQWISQISGTTTTLLAVRFATSKIGWTMGYGGEILKTTNGGTSWNPQTSGTSQTLYSIKIIDSNNVYISGDFGTVLHTTNGGDTWTALVTGADVSLYSVDFFSPSLGWAVGDDGVIIGTTDGGTTWKYQNSMTTHTLWGVQVVNGTTGGVVFAAGIGGTIVCSGISPLPVRTWIGAFDSLWTSAGNWSPAGVPEKLDSVYISTNATPPVIKHTAQQMNIAKLTIAPGGKLTIYNGLTEFIIKDNISINGKLEIDASSSVQIITGGDFFVGLGGTFVPGNSSVYMTGSGQIRGTFNNVLLSESSAVRSIGSVTVKNSFIALANLDLRATDTLTIQNAEANAFQGPGFITAGTVKRALKSASTDLYRFESPATYLQFYPAGTLPDTIVMTSHPNSLPPGQQDSLFARRYYNINAIGGSNYLAFMSLRFDTSETTIPIYNLSLFRDSSGVLFNMNSQDYLDSDIVAIYADSVKRFSPWYIGRADYYPKHPFEFLDSLFLTDNGSITDTLFFGAVAGATDGIDAALGETPLGPPPSPGTFDVRWVIPSTQGTIIDKRDLLSTSDPQNTYTCRLQPGPGGYPFTVRWNMDAFALGTFFLRDEATHGGQFNVSMKQQSSYTITNPAITQIEIVHIAPTYYSFSQGWNLLSIPLTITGDSRKIRMFPTAISNAFGFNSSYYVAESLKNGIGYWLKFATAQSLPIEGTTRTLDTIMVASGWNIIGSISNAVAVSSIQQVLPGIVSSPYFSYQGSYVVADSIRPSKGYWVKCNAPGILILSSSSAAPKQSYAAQPAHEMLKELNTLTVTDRNGHHQTLYFGKQVNPSFAPEFFAMPPSPPEEMFDVRFSSGSMVEMVSQPSSSYGIQIQSLAYPLTVSWHLIQPSMKSLSLNDATTGTILSRASASDGSIRINNPSVTKLNMKIDVDVVVPKEFALMQNYPNPFNPTTTIVFDLPKQSSVTLKIFNILGQEIVVLSENQDYLAGTHSLSLNAEQLASGVYFYQIVAKDGTNKEFRQVKKMLLMK